MAIDGKINKVCCDYKTLGTKDVKMQALGGIATNLGNFKFMFYNLLIWNNRRFSTIQILMVPYCD